MAAVAETPQEVARRVIKSDIVGISNAENETTEELNKCAAINSQYRLQFIMLSDAVSEELRVCYALRVIKEQRVVRLAGDERPSTSGEQKLTDSDRDSMEAHFRQLNQKLDSDRDILAAYLRQLQKSKN